MPLRRRPPEPSPRLRALLERAGAGARGAEAEPRAEGAQDTGAAAYGAEVGPRAEGAGDAGAPGREEEVGTAPEGGDDVGFWQPERAWLASPRQTTPLGGVTRPAPAPGRGDSPTHSPAPGTLVGATLVPGRHRRPRAPGPAWLVVPEALRGARLTAPRAAAAGLLLVVLVATLVFGARVAMARSASEPRPVAPAPAQTGVLTRGSSTFAGSATSAGGGGPPTTAAVVTVHVVGQVAHPGVLRLPAGSRVGDAVTRAGGALKGADLAAINLARVLADGEQVRVPKPGEVVPPAGAGPAGGSGSPGGAPGGPSGGSGGAGGLVDLNAATPAQLEDLPGVGPVLAQRIVDWRTEHGRFTTVEELNEVSGIGEKIFAQLKPKVTV